MSCPEVPIQVIAGSECIGDSLTKINANFSVLGAAFCEALSEINTLSSQPLVPIASETIQSQLEGKFFSSSINLSSLKMEHLMFEHGSFGFRNRIINGDMAISQRWEQTPVLINSSVPVYVVDRWYGFAADISSGGTFSLQQSALGFGEYCLIAKTVTPEISLGVSKKFGFAQKIEGFNVRDLKWGTLNASSIVISFVAKTNMGENTILGGSITNNSNNRSFPFEYTFAGTGWQYFSILIPGDTTGTWLTNEEAGLVLNFSLGTGTVFRGEKNVWSSQGYQGASDQANPIVTEQAYVAIKNVQVEVGNSPTPFEIRPFQAELDLCKRYFEKSYKFGVPPGTNTTENCFFFEGTVTGGSYNNYIVTPFSIEKRTPPSVAAIYSTGGTKNMYKEVLGNVDKSASPSNTRINTKFVVFEPSIPGTNINPGYDYIYHWTADSEL